MSIVNECARMATMSGQFGEHKFEEFVKTNFPSVKVLKDYSWFKDNCTDFIVGNTVWFPEKAQNKTIPLDNGIYFVALEETKKQKNGTVSKTTKQIRMKLGTETIKNDFMFWIVENNHIIKTTVIEVKNCNKCGSDKEKLAYKAFGFLTFHKNMNYCLFGLGEQFKIGMEKKKIVENINDMIDMLSDNRETIRFDDEWETHDVNDGLLVFVSNGPNL